MMNEELEKRIEQLGVHFGSKGLIHTKKNLRDPNGFETGVISENRLGKFFYIDQVFSADYSHGEVEFNQILGRLAAFELPDISMSLQWSNCVFLDTETTGLSQSAGTFAFMVGVSRFENGKLLLRQYFLKNPSEEAAMLLDLSNFFPENAILVSYNGVGFDIPILTYRYRLHKMQSPFLGFAHLDLLRYSRALWRYQFGDRSLKSVETKILFFRRASEEVPGWMAPEIYRQFLRTGNLSEINGVFYHNAMDVVSLTALLYRYIEILNQSSTASEQFSTVSFALGKLHEKNKNIDRSISYYLAAIQQSELSDDVRIKAIRQLGNLYKRSGNYEDAIPLWEKGSQIKDVFCILELCKYYEHKARNFDLALYWVDQGFELISPTDEYPLYIDLKKRQMRISGKVEKNG